MPRNAENKRKWFKTYYQKNKEKILKYNLEFRTTFKEGQMLSNAKSRAKKNGLEFNIDVSDVIIPQFCPILGIELVRDNTTVQSNSPTLDRINTTKGYIKGNVWVISFKANTMKSDATKDELIRFARAVLNFYGGN